MGYLLYQFLATFPLGLLCFGFSTVAPPEQHILQPSSDGGLSHVRHMLKHSSVIPDVLEDFRPSHAVSVAYPEAHESVSLGNEIPPKSVSARPLFEFHALAANSGIFLPSDRAYTLILTDPDATSRQDPKWSEFCHWIVTNLTTNAIPSALTPKDDELIDYFPPGPPPYTGRHRYVFVLLEGHTGQKLSAPKERKHWGYGKVRHGVQAWAKENNLRVAGANFFYSANEKQ